jgi:DNA invertase Pin-like site-specific DNA recombinase
MEGIAKARAAGVYKGRKPRIDAAQIRKLRGDGLGPAAIARKLRIGRASVYRLLAR